MNVDGYFQYKGQLSLFSLSIVLNFFLSHIEEICLFSEDIHGKHIYEGKILRQVQGSKIAYFSNKFLRIWGHMKALVVLPVHMRYCGPIC